MGAQISESTHKALDAIWHGDADRLRDMINSEDTISDQYGFRSSYGLKPFIWRDHEDWVQASINRRAGIDSMTPLKLAIQKDNKFITQMLLQRGANPNLRTDYMGTSGQTVVHMVVEMNKPDYLTLLLDCGGDMNLLGGDYKGKTTPMHLVIKRKDANMLRDCLKKKREIARCLTEISHYLKHVVPNINVVDEPEKDTLLHLALKTFGPNIYEYRTVFQTSSDGKPLKPPIEPGPYDANPFVNHQKKYIHWAPLTVSVKPSDCEIIDMILDHEGFDPMLVNARRMIPMHLACKYGNQYAMSQLLHKFHQRMAAEKMLRMKGGARGYTPLHYAVKYGYTQMVLELFGHWASENAPAGHMVLRQPNDFIQVEAPDSVLTTPLMIAISMADPAMVELMICGPDCTPKIDEKDSKGETALFFALGLHSPPLPDNIAAILRAKNDKPNPKRRQVNLRALESRFLPPEAGDSGKAAAATASASPSASSSSSASASASATSKGATSSSVTIVPGFVPPTPYGLPASFAVLEAVLLYGLDANSPEPIKRDTGNVPKSSKNKESSHKSKRSSTSTQDSSSSSSSGRTAVKRILGALGFFSTSSRESSQSATNEDAQLEEDGLKSSGGPEAQAQSKAESEEEERFENASSEDSVSFGTPKDGSPTPSLTASVAGASSSSAAEGASEATEATEAAAAPVSKGGAKEWGLPARVPYCVLFATYLLQHQANAEIKNKADETIMTKIEKARKQLEKEQEEQQAASSSGPGQGQAQTKAKESDALKRVLEIESWMKHITEPSFLASLRSFASYCHDKPYGWKGPWPLPKKEKEKETSGAGVGAVAGASGSSISKSSDLTTIAREPISMLMDHLPDLDESPMLHSMHLPSRMRLMDFPLHDLFIGMERDLDRDFELDRDRGWGRMRREGDRDRGRNRDNQKDRDRERERERIRELERERDRNMQRDRDRDLEEEVPSARSWASRPASSATTNASDSRTSSSSTSVTLRGASTATATATTSTGALASTTGSPTASSTGAIGAAITTTTTLTPSNPSQSNSTGDRASTNAPPVPVTTTLHETIIPEPALLSSLRLRDLRDRDTIIREPNPLGRDRFLFSRTPPSDYYQLSAPPAQPTIDTSTNSSVVSPVSSASISASPPAAASNSTATSGSDSDAGLVSAVTPVAGAEAPAAKQKKEDDSEEVKKLRDEVQSLRQEQLCTVCVERKKNCVFQCGHRFCTICANNPLLTRCPICRQMIVARILIFDS